MADLKICFGSQSGLRGWVGFQESYVIFRVGHGKCLRSLTRWVGGVKKGQKNACVIFEWSLTKVLIYKSRGELFLFRQPTIGCLC